MTAILMQCANSIDRADLLCIFWFIGSHPRVGPALMGLQLKNLGSYEMINEVKKINKNKLNNNLYLSSGLKYLLIR